MIIHKGVATIAVLIAIGALIVLGGAGYWYTRPDLATAPEAKEETQKPPALVAQEGLNIADISPEILNNKQIATVFWKLEDAGGDEYVSQRTKVTIVFRGVEHEIGIFNGGCAELGAKPGVDGKGLLIAEGELAAVQCWYAGGGDEIGVFRDTDSFSIKIGTIGEGEEGTGITRGGFVTKFKLD